MVLSGSIAVGDNTYVKRDARSPLLPRPILYAYRKQGSRVPDQILWRAGRLKAGQKVLRGKDIRCVGKLLAFS